MTMASKFEIQKLKMIISGHHLTLTVAVLIFHSKAISKHIELPAGGVYAMNNAILMAYSTKY